MKNLEIQVVDSICGALDEIQNQIRIRAYEKFLNREPEPNLALDDWLDAERELIYVLTAAVTRQDEQTVAEIEIPNIHIETLRIQATQHEALIDAVVSDSSRNPGFPEAVLRRAFGVIRFGHEIDPTTLRASYRQGVLRLMTPAGTKKFMRTA